MSTVFGRAMMPMPCPKPVRLLIVLGASIALSVVHAQDPVIKPPADTSGLLQRLPAPNPISARQLPDGTIEVQWPALEGAVKYQVTRSVPPNPVRVVAEVSVPQTRYVDRDIQVGSTYYYLVAGWSSAGVLGLKGASTPVRAMIAPGAGMTGVSVAGLTAQVTPPNRVLLHWTVSGAVPSGVSTEAVLERVATTASGTLRSRLAGLPLSVTSFDDTLNVVEPTQVTYQLSLAGLAAAPVVSNPVTLPDTISTTPTTSTATAGSSTTFTAAAPVTLRVGTTSAMPAGSAGGRLLSMNEFIATVDSTGTIRAVAAGTTQVVTLTSAADGSLRIVAVPVTVTP